MTGAPDTGSVANGSEAAAAWTPGRALRRRWNALRERARRSFLVLVWHRLRGSPVPPPYDVKRYRLARLQRRYGLRTFVESGTYRGDTLMAMVGRFETLHSIELAPALCEEARRRVERFPRARVHLGDSGEVLPRILEGVADRCLFWLDGHWSAGPTARGERSTPIARELAAIAAHGRRDHVIVIDDARKFDGTDDYPTRERVFELLRRINPDYDIRIVDDMIVACL